MEFHDNPTALASRNVPDNVMSSKGKKAAAPKASKERSPLVTTGITPVRSPLDDGLRSQMFNLSSALSGSRTLPARRRSGGNEPLLSLDLDPPPKRRKQKKPSSKEDSSPPSWHASGDPNLGSRLKDAIDRRAQQAQNRVLDEQTPLKERIDRPHSAKESSDSSSAADDSISKDGPVSFSAVDDSIAKESPDSSSACGNNTKGLPLMEKSNQSLPLKPVSSRKPNVDWAETSPDTSVNMNKEC
jgi:hypothetical protein